MAESKSVQLPARGKTKSPAEPAASASQPLGAETKQKLQELDAFIEKVLQEAGEEFLEEFRQIEGE